MCNKILVFHHEHLWPEDSDLSPVLQFWSPFTKSREKQRERWGDGEMKMKGEKWAQSRSVIMLFDWRWATPCVQRTQDGSELWDHFVQGWCQTGGGGIGAGGGSQGGGWLYRIPPNVNYLLFALDNPGARCAARNENPESQGLHLKKRRKKRGGKKQCRCHYHIISAWSIMNETHIKQGEAGVYENDLCE